MDGYDAGDSKLLHFNSILRDPVLLPVVRAPNYDGRISLKYLNRDLDFSQGFILGLRGIFNDGQIVTKIPFSFRPFLEEASVS